MLFPYYHFLFCIRGAKPSFLIGQRIDQIFAFGSKNGVASNGTGEFNFT